jgi:hypothetical protein
LAPTADPRQPSPRAPRGRRVKTGERLAPLELEASMAFRLARF